MFCRIWLEVAASFCWCSCHPSAASYSMSLLDKVSSALHLFLLRAFYVPSESIFWASDTLFLAASSSAGCLEHFPPHSCECLMQTSLRHWPHSSPCAALAEVIFTPRRRVKNVIQKCTLGALLPPCVTASSFLWNSISLRHILGFFPLKMFSLFFSLRRSSLTFPSWATLACWDKFDVGFNSEAYMTDELLLESVRQLS